MRGGTTLSTPLAAEDALLAAAAARRGAGPVGGGGRGRLRAGARRGPHHRARRRGGPRPAHRPQGPVRRRPRRSCPGSSGGRWPPSTRIDPDDVPGLEVVDTLGRLRDGLDLVEEARPAFELALRWLHDHEPPHRPPPVVHGDFRIGNLLVDETGLRAVLDWELSHLGDPLEDLGWLCVRAWRFGGEGEVGGVGPLEDLLEAYADATGAPVSADDVRWWIVAGTLTWGLICAVQARRHLDGHVRSVELATIGRRVCETEYDLLDLLGVAAPEPAERTDPPDGADAAGIHGRPTAAELVDAVRAHLDDVVAPQLDGAAAFQLKVAGNALGIVARELPAPAHVRPERRRRAGPGRRHPVRRPARPRGGRPAAGRRRRPPAGGQPPLAPRTRSALTTRSRVGATRLSRRETETCRRRGRS